MGRESGLMAVHLVTRSARARMARCELSGMSLEIFTGGSRITWGSDSTIACTCEQPVPSNQIIREG